MSQLGGVVFNILCRQSNAPDSKMYTAFLGAFYILLDQITTEF